ncbi:M23 family metallopeptidase [Cryobacterium sp. BB736]|uniref:M23 family metallopeptidase n=1 Tax=Cryobacterium sp. BB736 TaxID=2746963 RepID=UPI001876B585|nr:M23 family metallopeptidase [Cryobacterium sp. BB736]
MLLPPPADPIRLLGLALAFAFVVVGVPASLHAAGAQPAVWSWPLAPPHPIARPFIAPPTPYSAGHRGIDITAVPGADVLAPAAGLVHFSGVVVDRPVLSIRHPGGLISSFEPVASPLKAGDAVSGGQPVGTLEAGHCATACLHFGVRLHGEYVSPLNYLGGVSRAVLLPTRSLD